jgi:hypothetical protein
MKYCECDVPNIELVENGIYYCLDCGNQIEIIKPDEYDGEIYDIETQTL